MQKKTSSKKYLSVDDPANFFILYANSPLKNPENLKVIFEKISQFERKYLREINPVSQSPDKLFIRDWDLQSPRIVPGEISFIIKEIVDLIKDGERVALELNSRINAREADRSFIEKYKRRLSISPIIHNIAFEAVYAYTADGCKDCDFNIEQQRKFQFVNTYGKDFLTGKNRINCIECEQLAFQLMLNEITDNRSYNDLLGFGEYLAARNERTKACATRGIRQLSSFVFSQNKTSLGQKEIFDPASIYYREKNFAEHTKDYKYIFANYLRSLMGFSLINYLMNKKKGDIYRCRYRSCSNFYLSKKKDIKNKFCPDCTSKNKMPKEEHQKYLRERYQKQKKEENKSRAEKELRLEKEYKKRMLDLGNTKEEADMHWQENKEQIIRENYGE